MSQQITTHDLWADGRNISITATKPSATVLQLTWNLPSNSVAYDGAVVLVSEFPFNAENLPIDGTKYVGSTNWVSPNSTIGDAKVVSAFYGFFGDNIQQTTVTVTDLDPNKVYYASIHACSNVLQYYTIGSQSYPLEANNPVKKNSAYAGSIPESSTPPLNPTDGQVYFDISSANVLIWNNSQSAWVKASQRTTPIGVLPPITTAQIFYTTGNQSLQYFDGATWILADATNVRVKMGATWAAFTSIIQLGNYPPSPIPGDFLFLTNQVQLSAPVTFSMQFFSLGTWFNPTPDLVQVLIGGVWTPISPQSSTNFFGSNTPPIPAIGDFFYSTQSKDLLVWTGNTWIKADTAQEGTPTTDKTNVGTDGTYAARIQLMQEVKSRMGYPAVCVELDDGMFNDAINNALTSFRQRSGNAYAHRHVSFTLYGGATGGQAVYYLNDPRDKTNKIVNVIKIYRINQLGISSLSAESGLYAQAFFNQLYQGSNVDVLSIHLMAQLSETFEKIFAGNIMFTWDEATRELIILRRLQQPQERVILEVEMEREEQELITDRWCKMWIQDWAYADSLERLGLIRSKYGTLPGANGGITLNGDTLLAMASEKKTELLRQIADYEVGNADSAGNFSVFMG